MIEQLGIPYMGSKRKLASKIVDFIIDLNKGVEYVYDVFGGGGAISYEFVRRQQIKRVYYNDLNTSVCELIKKIQKDGVTKEFYNWVSREDFNSLKNGNDWKAGLVKTCWSFGNNQKTYMYGERVEPIKKQFHDYVFYKKDLQDYKNINSDNIQERANYIKRQAKGSFENIMKNLEIKRLFKKYQNILDSKHSKETTREFCIWFRTTGIRPSQVDKITNSGMGKHYLAKASQHAIPTIEMWNLLKANYDFKDIPEWVNNLFYTEGQLKILNEELNKLVAGNESVLNKLNYLERFNYLERLNSLNYLQHLERLNSLSYLEHQQSISNLPKTSTSLPPLSVSNLDYKDVKIDTPTNKTIVYLDPPYFNTAKYEENLCHNELYEWIQTLTRQGYRVYLSSYESPLYEVLDFVHRCTLSGHANNRVNEKLYSNFCHEKVDNRLF